MRNVRPRNHKRQPRRQKIPLQFRKGEGELIEKLPIWANYISGEYIYIGGQFLKIKYAFCVNRGKHYNEVVFVDWQGAVYNISDVRVSIPDDVKKRINERSIADGHGKQFSILELTRRGRRK